MSVIRPNRPCLSFNCLLVTDYRLLNNGGSGIRTHGPFRVSGFQDRCNKPLYHPSKVCSCDDWRRSVTAKYVIEEAGVNGKRLMDNFGNAAIWKSKITLHRSLIFIAIGNQ